VDSVCTGSRGYVCTIVDQQAGIAGAGNRSRAHRQRVEHTRAQVLFTNLNQIDPRVNGSLN
jgi:hypothetical protein